MASGLLAFWHIATILPPEIVYEFGGLGRNGTYSSSNSGNFTILLNVGDQLKLICQSDYDTAWIKLARENKVRYVIF